MTLAHEICTKAIVAFESGSELTLLAGDFLVGAVDFVIAVVCLSFQGWLKPPSAKGLRHGSCLGPLRQS